MAYKPLPLSKDFREQLVADMRHQLLQLQENNEHPDVVRAAEILTTRYGKYLRMDPARLASYFNIISGRELAKNDAALQRLWRLIGGIVDESDTRHLLPILRRLIVSHEEFTIYAPQTLERIFRAHAPDELQAKVKELPGSYLSNPPQEPAFYELLCTRFLEALQTLSPRSLKGAARQLAKNFGLDYASYTAESIVALFEYHATSVQLEEAKHLCAFMSQSQDLLRDMQPFVDSPLTFNLHDAAAMSSALTRALGEKVSYTRTVKNMAVLYRESVGKGTKARAVPPKFLRPQKSSTPQDVFGLLALRAYYLKGTDKLSGNEMDEVLTAMGARATQAVTGIVNDYASSFEKDAGC